MIGQRVGGADETHAPLPRTREVEHVIWYRFVVHYRIRDDRIPAGRRRCFVHWSPGWPWVRDEVVRYFVEDVGVDNIVPGSAVIRGPT